MVQTSAVELGIIDLLAREGRASAWLLPSQSFAYLLCTLHGDQSLHGHGPKSKYFVSSEAGFTPLLRFLQHKTVIGQTVKNGGSPVQNANVMSIFKCAVKDPAFSTLLNNGMKAPTSLYMNKLLESYRGFEGAKTVADVGGGVGECLRLILDKFPNLGRMEHVGGDLSKSIPKADILFMNDCYDALPPNGKVVIPDPILPNYPETNIVSRNTFTSDMIMLGTSPGGVTRKEMEALALSAGFDKPRIPCRAYNMSLQHVGYGVAQK
ncbi:hypothetical protein ACJRO7_011314 [Eucalyptus globulus]|uniref:O-methyltransferase C-terminal domain-containing protein n=1 Tax=Eucalyptus globulus TaxID=34317 RepID=A0ABD3LFL3_EUCGL